jgi:hypothetical protein
MKTIPRHINIIAYLEWMTAAGFIGYWVLFVTIGLAPVAPPEGYFVYERSFPLPDLLLAVTCIISGVMLLKQNPFGQTLSLSCAGALIFLGVLDFSFNFQNGIYTLSTLDLVMNGFLNLWCVSIGILILLSLNNQGDPYDRKQL